MPPLVIVTVLPSYVRAGSVHGMAVTVVDGDLTPGLARALRKAGRVAVDTETSGLDWATDRLELCQLFSPPTGPVLVRHVSDAPLELAGLLDDVSVLKVLHFAPFDLKFLEAHASVNARSVACTKAASKLLDPGLLAPEHGLQALLLRHLNVKISKGAVRTSDWGSAELTDEQLSYAISDVMHLLDLFDVLHKQLESRGLVSLYGRVCNYMPVDAHLEVAGVPDPLTY